MTGTTQKTEQDPTEAVDTSLFVTYRRHEMFNDRLELIGTHCTAAITWRPPAQRYDTSKGTIVELEEKRPFARLEFALEIAFNGRKPESEDEPHAVQVRKHGARSIEVTTDARSLNELRANVGYIVDSWRRGELSAHPVVSVDEHKIMALRGIKVRKDGLFGYHLKCARKLCDNDCDTCYAALSIAEAIEDMDERRSTWTCSRECFVLEHGFSELNEDFLNDLVDPQTQYPVLYHQICKYAGINAEAIENDGLEAEGQPSVTDRILALREQRPALWKDLMEVVDSWDVDSDYWSEDGGSVPCEA